MKRLLLGISVFMLGIALSQLAWAGAYDGIKRNIDNNKAFTGQKVLHKTDLGHQPGPGFGIGGNIFTTGKGGRNASNNSVVDPTPARTRIQAPGQ